MKFKKLLLIPLLITLTGCSSNDELTIISPVGAPAIAFYKYSNSSNFETNSGDASNIIATMVNNTKDIVVLPTNAGVQAITKRNLDYKLAATITFGNLYVVSTGNDADGVMNDGDYILLFQKNQLPDLMFHYVYGEFLESNTHYVASAQEAASCLKAGVDLTNDNKKIDYALLAEPAVTAVLKAKPEYKVYANLQEQYKNKSGGFEMFQASVFVSNKKKPNVIKSFLSSLEEDIKNGLENPELIKKELEDKKDKISSLYGISFDQIEGSIHKIGLGYKNAFENKAAIDNYLKIFNLGGTNEEIYF